MWMGGASLKPNVHLEVIHTNCLPTEEMCLLYSQCLIYLDETSLEGGRLNDSLKLQYAYFLFPWNIFFNYFITTT